MRIGLSLAFAAALALGLVGCGKQNQETAGTAATQPPAQSAAEPSSANQGNATGQETATGKTENFESQQTPPAPSAGQEPGKK